MVKLFFIYLILFSYFLTAQTYSLSIGINKNGLIGAENDAQEMLKVFSKRGINNNKLLIGESATKENIVNSFKNIVAMAKSGDWVYLFFSGHGTSYFDASIANNSKLKERLKDTGALLTADGKLIVIKEVLAPLFRKLDKKDVNTVVIFDACFMGMGYKDKPINLPFYTPKLTRESVFPYKHLIYLSSTTSSDYASESVEDKRGYFSMAISKCLEKYSTREGIVKCLDKIKYKDNKLPQQPIILPKSNFTIFPSLSNKNITIKPTTKGLKEQLFNLVNQKDGFKLFAINSSGSLVKSYKRDEVLSIHLKSSYSGYFVLFMMGESGNLKLSYPNSKKMPFISKGTDKKIFTIKAKSPYGKEMIGAFLVDKNSAKKLKNLYKETRGSLNEAVYINKAIEIIKQNQIVGDRVQLHSYDK